jgi:hypothetical protein
MKHFTILTLILVPLSTTFAVSTFTETFTTNSANWRITDSITPMAWVSSGGPAGAADAYASNTNVTFIGLADGASRLAVRGHASFGTSGGAFVGNWLTSGVYAFSIDVRHNLGVPALIGLRIAAPANSPGASIEPTLFLPSDEWGTLVVPIHPANPGFISFGAGSFTGVFSSVGNLQVLLYAPTGFGGAAGPFTLDLDNPAVHTPGAGAIVAATDAPTYDRWMYPFNASSPIGNRPTASSFGALDPDFDNRDAQVYVGFVLTNDVPAGLGADAYQIVSCRFEATMSDGAIEYDPTLDAWTSYLDPTQALYTADTDIGRPMELYGAGWRGTNTALSFGEDGAFQSLPPPWKNKRNVYALGVRDGALVDVSNSIDMDSSFTNGFDPTPFAVGTASVTPGAAIPLPTTFTFDLDTDHPLIQSYLQDALDDGILSLMLATLHPSSFMGPAVFPVWDQKENVVGTPAALTITYRLNPALSGGVQEDVRVVRWSFAAAPVLVERAVDLAAPVWTPLTVMARTNAAGYATVVMSTNTMEFMRLRTP